MLAINLSLIACLCWGLSQFLAGIKARTLPVLTLLAYTSAAGFTVFIISTMIRGVPLPREPNLIFALLGGVASIGGIYCLYHGLAVGAISIVVPVSALCALVPVIFSLVSVVSSLYPVVPIVLAAIFLKERLHRIQLIGVILIIGGIAMISI